MTAGKRDAQPDMEAVVSILIANYNARDLLAQCLESIYRHPCSVPFEILVVDDHSHDASYEMVRERFPDVRLTRNERNLHYATSNNRMIDRARGRYLYLLNSDTLMHPHALDRLVAYLEVHPETGCVGSRLLNEDGSVQASVKTLPSFRSALFGSRSYIYKLFPNNPFSKSEMLHLSEDMSEPFKAGYVSSASWLMRREVVDKVGYLDSRLSYHVDADYCARIWEHGWDVVYLPEAVVTHLDHKGGTLLDRKRRLKSVIEFHRGTWLFFQRHQMRSPWHPVTWLVALGLSGRFVCSLIVQQLSELPGLLRGESGRAKSPSGE